MGKKKKEKKEKKAEKVLKSEKKLKKEKKNSEKKKGSASGKNIGKVLQDYDRKEPVSGKTPESIGKDQSGEKKQRRSAQETHKEKMQGSTAAHREKTPDTSSLNLAAVFHTLSDENRLRILDLLAEREMCAFEILHSLAVAQSTISHHMKVLCETGLVICEKRGKRSCYHINGQNMEQIAAYIRKWGPENE